METKYNIGDIVRDTKADIHYLVEDIRGTNYVLRYLEKNMIVISCIKTCECDVFLQKLA